MFLDEAKKPVPDVLSWYVLSDADNLSAAFEVPRIHAALAQRGLNSSVKLIINEYGGGKAQDGPASAAWWVAQLERYNIAGCRSIECACCTSELIHFMHALD